MGIISDTHGRLRPEALAALADSDLLLHAGDVGEPDIVERLTAIAPLHAVRGNVDDGEWAHDLPLLLSLDLERVSLLLYHGHVGPPAERVAAAQVIVQGHSHRPEVARREGKLYVNPGSAGRRRFGLPVTVARLRIDGDDVEAELVELL